MSLRWDYFVNAYDTTRYVPAPDGRDNRHVQFVREFASVVSVLQVCRRVCFSLPSLSRTHRLLQDKTNTLIDLYKEITRVVEDLSTCPYTAETFLELIAKIQAAVRFSRTG